MSHEPGVPDVDAGVSLLLGEPPDRGGEILTPQQLPILFGPPTQLPRLLRGYACLKRVISPADPFT
jgi:hypothetical protein